MSTHIYMINNKNCLWLYRCSPQTCRPLYLQITGNFKVQRCIGEQIRPDYSHIKLVIATTFGREAKQLAWLLIPKRMQLFRQTQLFYSYKVRIECNVDVCARYSNTSSQYQRQRGTTRSHQPDSYQPQQEYSLSLQTSAIGHYQWHSLSIICTVAVGMFIFIWTS